MRPGYFLLFAAAAFLGIPGTTEGQNSPDRPVLKVATLLEEPFIMKNTENPEATGNDQFVGFIKDFLDEIMDIAKFNYSLYLTPDGRWGGQNKDTLEWFGMFGEVGKGKAQMAAGSLTVTSGRHMALDLTKPFMFTGLSLLHKRPALETGGGPAFVTVLTPGAWMSLVGIYLFVSVMFWLIARCAPTERRRYDDDDVDEHVYSIRNSLWYTIGAFVLRGNEANPKAISVRLLTFFWWIFSIVLVAIYVSMVAEKYTTLHYATRIKTWKDMINQDYVQVGLVRGGSTESFFKSSTVPEIKLMWEKMQKHPDWLATSLADGIQRVRDGNGRYAFFAETLSVDYLIHRECDLVKIGPELAQRSYGFALQKKSLYTHAISAAILRLQEQGAVQALYTKWWHDTTSENCDRKSDEDRRVDAIDAGHLRGIFVPVIIVAFLAMFVALVELVWTCIWRGDLSKPFSTRLRMELQQIIGFNVPISRQGLRNEFEQ